jgi:hypothetical protein
MSEVVERATKAAFDEIRRQDREHAQTEADDFSEYHGHPAFTDVLPYDGFNLNLVIRAAIEAMREPSVAMIAAANRLNHPRDEEVWRTMIDAALRA